MAFPRRFQPTVSDHASVRWISLVHGGEHLIEAIRAEILAEGREAWVAKGVASVTCPSLRVTIVAKDGAVVTIHAGNDGARI